MQKKKTAAMANKGEVATLSPDLVGKDLSLLNPPIPLGVTNIRQVLSCLTSGTTEMKDLILNECKLRLECKFCRSIFHRASKFVDHRLNHCQGNVRQAGNPPSLHASQPPHFTEIVQPAPPPPPPSQHNKRKSKPSRLVLPQQPSENSSIPSSQSSIPTSPTDPLEEEMTSPASSPSQDQETQPCLPPENGAMPMDSPDGTHKENIVPGSDLPFIQDLVDKAKKNKKLQQHNHQLRSNPKKTLNNILNHRLNNLRLGKEKDENEPHPSESQIKMFTRKSSPTKVVINKGALPRLPGSPGSNIFDRYLHQLRLKEKQAQGMAFHLTPIPGNGNAMFQVRANPGETELKRPVHMKENPPDQKPVVVVITKPVVDKIVNKRLAAKKQQQQLPQQPAREVPESANVFRCDKCKNFFSTAKTLQIHKRKIHAASRLCYPCLYCKATFVQIWSVSRHMESIHRKPKDQLNKLKEAVRKKAFLKKNDEIPQLEVDKEDGHECPSCSKVFPKKQQLATHLRFCNKKPSASKDHASSISAKKTESKSCSPPPPAAAAVATKSGKDKKAPVVKEEEPVQSRPKRLNTNKKMDKDFVDSQTFFKNFSATSAASKGNKDAQSPTKKCVKTIEKKVLSLIDLSKLMCLKCSKTFSTFSNLRRHTAIHIGWKRFKCKGCDHSFYNKFDCKEHITRMHPSTEQVNDLVEELPCKAAFSGRNAVANLRQNKTSPG